MKQKEDSLWNKEIPLPFVILVITSVVGILIFYIVQERKGLNTLISMNPQQISSFKISYSGKLGKESIVFFIPDTIIDDFFYALSDANSYSPSHDTVASNEHSWFMEISTKEDTIQLGCYIPSRKTGVVIGQPKTWGDSGYSDFQSRNLYQWYQKYKDRWLNLDTPQEGS